jgi:hypothetical protein
MGYQAGYLATGASNSVFFGNRAGYSATSAYYSNFFGMLDNLQQAHMGQIS